MTILTPLIPIVACILLALALALTISADVPADYDGEDFYE